LEVVFKIYLARKFKEAHALHSKLTFLDRGTIKRQNLTRLGTVNVIFQKKSYCQLERNTAITLKGLLLTPLHSEVTSWLDPDDQFCDYTRADTTLFWASVESYKSQSPCIDFIAFDGVRCIYLCHSSQRLKTVTRQHIVCDIS